MVRWDRVAGRSPLPVLLVAGLVALAALTVTLVNAGVGQERPGMPPDAHVGRLAHGLEALQRIADENGGTRASGTPGYKASRDYVVARLRRAGYRPRVQAFRFGFYQQLAPAELSRVAPLPRGFDNPDDFTDMRYSGSGDVTARAVAVDTDLMPTTESTSGCEEADFAGFPPGSIAVMQQGGCSFATMALNAQAAGAAGAVISDNGTSEGTASFSHVLDPRVRIPVVGATLRTATEVAGATARLVTRTRSGLRTTWNVIAETPGGSPHHVVMAGAHLDSVLSGPGINDNGTGSVALLEAAERLAGAAPVDKVRFAWWGAEEFGKEGSWHYLHDLAAHDPAALRSISSYLNLDMIGSPNYVRLVYDGDGSAFPEGDHVLTGPAGSGAIERALRSYFVSHSWSVAETPLYDWSDHASFAREGIPVGGLFTGALGPKTEAETELFGGYPGVAYDGCYHRSCDDAAHVDVVTLAVMSEAATHALERLAGVRTRP